MDFSIRKWGNKCQVWNASKPNEGLYIELNGCLRSITNCICGPKGLSYSILQCSFLSLNLSNICNKLTPLILHGKQKTLDKIPLITPVNSYKMRHWLWITAFTPHWELIPIWNCVDSIKLTSWAEQHYYFNKKKKK